MTADSCPQCSTKHRSFPRRCYYAVHADHAHVVIARLASLGTSDQQHWAQEVTVKWNAMKEYVARWDGEVKP